MKKILIIGAGWEQLPLVMEAKSMGLYTVVTTWWDITKIPADKVYCVDSRDLVGLEKICTDEKPDYIIADECDYSMYAVSYLTSKFSLPGPTLYTQTITNNKYLQRQCIDKTEVKQPCYSLCWNFNDAKNSALKIGYPVIVKPIDNRGSIGVEKAENETELLSAWYSAIANAHSRMCIVEKFIDGDVITAEGFHDSEEFEFITASTKVMYEQNKNLAKILCYPARLSSDLIENIQKNAKQVARALSINFGFTHIEFMIERNTEEIFFIEAANRGGGVYISNKVLQEITGINYNRSLIELAMGRHVCVKCNQHYINKAIIYFMEFYGHEKFSQSRVKSNKECVTLFINQCIPRVSDLDNPPVRQGIGVFSGADISKLVQMGEQFEKVFSQDEADHYYVKE